MGALDKLINLLEQVEVEEEDIYKVIEYQQSTSKLVTQLGLLTQNYEVDKEVTLEEMENAQKAVQLLMKQLKEKYKLDGEANYDLVFPSDNAKNPNKAAFVKK